MRTRFMPPWAAALLLLAACLIFLPGPAAADPLLITPSTDAAAMAGSLIGSGSGITLVPGSATYAGAASASGFFSGGAGILPFNTGIVLTTGDALNLPGPNTSSGMSPDFSIDNSAPGYTPLQALTGGLATFNASVLSFRFIPTAGVISFRFVFGSEEYNEWVGSEFNDVFGFFLNDTNIALVPGTSTPITVNTINPSSYSAYYTDNTAIPSPLNTRLDGLAGAGLALYATGPVNAGMENTITLAIADTSDAIWDAAVFLQGGSFVQEPPPAPAPASLLLLGTGLLGLGAGWGLKKRSK